MLGSCENYLSVTMGCGLCVYRCGEVVAFAEGRVCGLLGCPRAPTGLSGPDAEGLRWAQTGGCGSGVPEGEKGEGEKDHRVTGGRKTLLLTFDRSLKGCRRAEWGFVRTPRKTGSRGTKLGKGREVQTGPRVGRKGTSGS